MLVVEKVIDISINYTFNSQYELHNIVFFDIETTGFSPEHTILYLIGCMYYKDNQWRSIQWFADNNTSEYYMLESFFLFIKDYSVIIHYNGSGFDIPYLLKKCNKHKLNYDFSKIESLDLYKKILPYKKIFKTENLKQKSIEKFLGISRDDTFSGGELIEVYGRYLKYKNFNQPETEELFNLLILHNEDDLKGMLQSVNILSYCDLFERDFMITNTSLKEDHLLIKFQLDNFLPRRVNIGNETLYLLAFGEYATLEIKLYKKELKFFYNNYKDYYYLPIEDTAIHKSVAFYVDKDFRTKARAANCYSKKTGCFLPQYNELIIPYFKIDYFDKINYFEPTIDIINNKDLMKQYVKHLFPKLLI